MSENVSKQIRSEVTKEGKLLLSVERTAIPEPKEDEVLIRIEASPINPSDLGLLIGPADVSSMSVSGEGENAVVTMDIPEGLMRMLETRLDQLVLFGTDILTVVLKLV